MDLTLRLGILKDAGQLSEKNYNNILETIKYFKENQNLELTEENAAMFITHLSAALERIDKGEIVNKIDEMIMEEIKKDSNYEKTTLITKDLENILCELPQEEKDFIEMHICTLLNK